MYTQNDKKSAVKEIQEYLFFLSDKKYPTIPRIPIDGTFDEETKQAVIEFQKLMSIAPTGKVDFETFTSLYIEFKNAEDDFNTDNYIFGYGNLPFKKNEQNEDIRALHIMINKMRKTYPQIPSVEVSSYFSSRTAAAISEIRKIFSLSGSPILDRTLYRRMKAEIDARERFEKFNRSVF